VRGGIGGTSTFLVPAQDKMKKQSHHGCDIYNQVAHWSISHLTNKVAFE
jgi:hypothetical protein